MKNPTEMLKEIKNILGIELSEDVKEQEVATENVEANAETNEESKLSFAQMKLENGTVLEAEAFEAGNEIFILTEDEKVAVPIGEYTMEDGQVLLVSEEGVISEIKAYEEKEEEAEEKEEMNYVTREELAEVVSMIEEIKAMIDGKEEAADEEAQLKEELSKPAAAPLKHNPEAEDKKERVLYAQKRALTTRDRVFQKFANIN